MFPDQFPNGLKLPMLGDDTAVEIHHFLEVAIQLFEARYGHQIDRYYEGLCKDHTDSPSIKSASEDPF
jgi:hypothetical protein